MQSWTDEEVVDLLIYLFNDTCACNYNGIDEWLPGVCTQTDKCPDGECWFEFLREYRKGYLHQNNQNDVVKKLNDANEKLKS